MDGAETLPPATWFTEMAAGSRIVFFILRVQPDIAYEYISGAVTDLIGVTPAEALADADAVHDQVDHASRETLDGAFATDPGEQVGVELKWRHRDTTQALYTRGWMRARQRPDGIRIIEGTVAEITELREVETELRRSEGRHRLLAENAWDVIWTMGLDGTITYVSPSVERVRGFTPAEAASQTIDQCNTPESGARVSAYYQQVFAAMAAGTELPVFRGDMEYYRKDGTIMTGELQVIPHVDANGEVVELLGVTRDVSDRKIFEAELTRLAITDPVTGVWNRRRGSELLDADLETALRLGQDLSLLMVDVDNFKTINDTSGHQLGDRVLADLARRLAESVRAIDVVARWGGDEFVVLLRQCAIDDALAVAEKLRAEVAALRLPEVGQVSVSIGAAQLRPAEGAEALLDRADAALYKAKRSGRNAVHG